PPNLSSLSSSRPMIVNASSSDRQLECGLFLIGGGELAKLCDSGGNDFERVGDVGGGGVAAEAEANAGAGLFWRHANRGEDMGRLDGAPGGSWSRGARKAFGVSRAG